MKKSPLQIALATLVIWLPNISWNFWIPLLVLAALSLVDLRSKFQFRFFGIISIYMLFLFLVKDDFSFVSYTIFFVSVLFLLSEIPLNNKHNIDIFINFSLVCISASLLYHSLNLNFIPLNSRPDYVSGTFFRIRLFFSEPAHFGLWCGFTAVLCIFMERNRAAAIFVAGILFSASLGALVFFILLFVCLYFLSNVKRNWTSLILVALFATVLIITNSEQFLSKLGEDSLSILLRSENFRLSLSFLIENFGIPNGFGPILSENQLVGVLNFNILLLISMGLFAFLLIPYQVITIHTFIPYLFIASFIGNFWESPMLVLLFNPHFLRFWERREINIKPLSTPSSPVRSISVQGATNEN